MQNLKYNIYSHADADGGIAAAIYGRHLTDSFAVHGWEIDIIPVNHGLTHGEWSLTEIQWPCAILDFTLHPQMLSERFFNRTNQTALRLGGAEKVPRCVWIDHHPTGSSYAFMNADNLNDIMPGVLTKWDVTAISTPGLMRTHRTELELPDELIARYEEFIDLAEIIDGALFASPEAAHDFDSDAVRLQTLFSSTHPAIDRNALYKKIVSQIMQNPSVEDLFDADPIFMALVTFERALFTRQLKAYRETTTKHGSVGLANFFNFSRFDGMGRFLPYILFPEVEYAIHIMPRRHGFAAISCGINPWNKPAVMNKHLGNYFAKHFSGGGHAFVAGGKIAENDLSSVEDLIEFINND